MSVPAPTSREHEHEHEQPYSPQQLQRSERERERLGCAAGTSTAAGSLQVLGVHGASEGHHEYELAWFDDACTGAAGKKVL